MTALIDTLFQIEKQLKLELDSLMPYAEQDNIGGFHPDPAQRQWDMGAIFDVEGRTLYAVIRALQPDTVVEIGSGTGCSATHICSALRANGHGHMTTVDRGNTPNIPEDYHPFVTILPGDGINYLALQPDNSIDFILEDADHTTELCHAIGELAKTKLKPGGVLFIHDIEHWAVGADIRAGYDLAGMEVRRYKTDPSDCGWGVWQKPSDTLPELSETQVMHHALFGLSYGLIDKTDDELLEEVQSAIMGEADASPVVDTAVLQAQEEPNADELPVEKKVKRTRKAKPAK